MSLFETLAVVAFRYPSFLKEFVDNACSILHRAGENAMVARIQHGMHDRKEEALVLAAESGWYGSVLLLLARGACIDTTDSYHEYSALHAASFKGRLDIMLLLVSREASLEVQCRRDGATPLHLAAAYGKEDAVRFLLEHHASIDARDYSDNTPLHDAASNGHLASVQLFIDKGAPINVQNKDGKTPLQLTEESILKDREGEKAIIQLLRSLSNPSTQPTVSQEAKKAVTNIRHHVDH